MKIKDASEIRRVEAEKPSETPRPRGGKAAAGDTVSTGSVERARAAVAIAAQDRAGRVEELAAAIREGAFRPDPERIARRILADAELSAALQSLLSR